MNTPSSETNALPRFPWKVWSLATLLMLGIFALIWIQSEYCAPDASGYRCAAPFDGLEKLLLLGVLVIGLAFMIGLATAIIRTAGWLYESRRAR